MSKTMLKSSPENCFCVKISKSYILLIIDSILYGMLLKLVPFQNVLSSLSLPVKIYKIMLPIKLSFTRKVEDISIY